MKTVSIPDYMSMAIQNQYDNERQKRNQKRADLWKRNPITGKKVISARYNDRPGSERR